MPDDPTYREETENGQTIYTCLIPDAGREGGICGHKVRDEGFMTQHMQQMHAGVMVKAPDETADEADAAPDAPPPSTDAPASAPVEEPAPTEQSDEPEEGA